MSSKITEGELERTRILRQWILNWMRLTPSTLGPWMTQTASLCLPTIKDRTGRTGTSIRGLR